MSAVCLFCNVSEKNYNQDSHIDLICSRCVILLADAAQNDLNRAHQKAIEKGYDHKISALESFIKFEGGEDEQQKPKSKNHRRHIDRTGIAKTDRIKKDRTERDEV